MPARIKHPAQVCFTGQLNVSCRAAEQHYSNELVVLDECYGYRIWGPVACAVIFMYYIHPPNVVPQCAAGAGGRVKKFLTNHYVSNIPCVFWWCIKGFLLSNVVERRSYVCQVKQTSLSARISL
jgi:hypothetical protein